MSLTLDYYYGNESEQFSFYRIPKVLFTDEHYKTASLEAKTLYGLMLDRMGLSARNGWLDRDGKVFIYFTQDDAQGYLGCGHNKATSLFRELESIGLIERKKQGQGKPTKIYVKNFVSFSEAANTPEQAVKTARNGPLIILRRKKLNRMILTYPPPRPLRPAGSTSGNGRTGWMR